uniref:Uncharacterized protein n=1 Tax=Leersia perrieri TaxID=77586 RepID=A0A0D9XIX2_9ORYZ
MDNAEKTIAYTDQDVQIRLFKVTTREFLSSSILKNPLLLKDANPQEIVEESHWVRSLQSFKHRSFGN